MKELETRLAMIRGSRFFRQTPAPDPPEEGGAEGSDVEEVETASSLSLEGVCGIDDVVIEIEIIHPSFLKPRGTHVMALGQHTIGDVIDLCTCTCDDAMKAVDETSNPRYVFIEGTFYVDDDNDPVLNDIDGIKRFCEKHGSRWPLDVIQDSSQEFKIGSLQAKLNEIPLRASNKPLYLYVHRGGCEHLIHIINVRLAHAKDLSTLTLGPVRTRTPFVTIRKCNICEKMLAAYVVYGSGMNITDPCFYCDTCYHLSHFDSDGAETSVAQGHVAFPYRGG